MTLWLTGSGVSRGVAIGRVHHIHSDALDIPERSIDAADIDDEIERFDEALGQARLALGDIRAQIPATAPGEIREFIDTHLMMMQDSSLTRAVRQLIAERQCNAEWALKIQQDHLVSIFAEMDDAYLRTRSDDVRHVAVRIQRALLREELERPADASAALADQIVVTDDLSPADIILMQQQGVAGMVIEHGGPLSHSAILARSLGIPMLAGVADARRLLVDGEAIIIDGEAAHLLAQPDESAIAFFRDRQQEEDRYRRSLGRIRSGPALSLDGRRIKLMANVELPDDSRAARAAGAEGVGLFRTEFLYLNREDMPGEEEQYEAYRRVIEGMNGPVTIRTLDLGADKTAVFDRTRPLSSNPALGLRAIRYCLKEPEIFRVQLRALLRASTHGELRILLPMVSSLQELQQARQLIDNCRRELTERGIDCDPEVDIGVMIEVPAAALTATSLARHADFFSIGTNDLIQYTLAMDRVDDEINYLYDPLHPAVLRLIRQTIRAGQAAGIPVSLCGEMASDRRYTRLLLGLGLTELSTHAGDLLEIKQAVLHSHVGELSERVDGLLRAADGDDYRDQARLFQEGATA